MPHRARPEPVRGAASLLAAGLAAGLTALPARAGEKTAVFPIELSDPGAAYGSRTRPADARKLSLVTDALRTALREGGGLDILDTAPADGEIQRQGPLYKCNGCAGDIARGLGAELAVTGTVERGANQILNLSVVIAEAASGRTVRGGQVTIRADTEDTWAHAMRWIVRNRLLNEPLPGKS